MKKTATFSAALVIGALGLSGCASELPAVPMTPRQATVYNDCMRNHWSGTTDTIWFGLFGSNYHQNVVISCRQLALSYHGQSANTDHAVSQPTSP